MLPGETNLFEHLWQTICKCCHKGNMINFHNNLQKHNQNNVFIHINICNTTVKKGISFWRKTKHLLGQGFYFMLGQCQSELVFPGGFKRGRRKMPRTMQRCMYERETPFCYREKLMRAAHDHGGSFNPVLWLYVMLSMVVNQRGCDVTKVSKIVNSNRKV